VNAAYPSCHLEKCGNSFLSFIYAELAVLNSFTSVAIAMEGCK
jgi:hypothetical protein